MEERYDSRLYSRYLPMPLKEDVDEERRPSPSRSGVEDFPGVSIETDWQRRLPVRPAGQPRRRLHGRDHGRGRRALRGPRLRHASDGEDVGRSGVELSMEEVLHGKWGEAVFEVDAGNRIVREISYEPPVNGQDIQLSIDLDLQQYAERLLQTQLRAAPPRSPATQPEVDEARDGTEQRARSTADLAVGTRVPYKAPAGSVIVMNQQTGQIVAMASYPTFDNRWFNRPASTAPSSTSCSPARSRAARAVDPDLSTLTNRAIQGQYNMGSTFKVFVAYAALATGCSARSDLQRRGHLQDARRSTPSVCAQGVRCVFRNSTCPHTGQPCVYGSVDVATSLAVSSDAFYYKLGEDFYLTPGTPLQDHVPPVRLRRRHGHRPAVRVRRSDPDQRAEGAARRGRRAAPRARCPNLSAGRPPADGDRPGPDGGLAAAAGRRLRRHRQRRQACSRRTSFRRSSSPRCPTASPGSPTSPRPRWSRRSRPQTRADPDARGRPRADRRRHAAQHHRARRQRPLDDGRGAVRVDYPPEAIPVAGKTGTAQGARQLPVERLVGVRRRSASIRERPYTVVSYLEKAGYGSTGAAPVVKCMFLALSGLTPARPGAASPTRSTSPSDQVAAAGPAPVDRACMASSDAGTIIPSGRLSRWACSMLQRKPDSGLGNIRSSPADPEPQHRLGAAARPGRC